MPAATINNNKWAEVSVGLAVCNMKLILIVARKSHRQVSETVRLLSDLLVFTVFGGDRDVAFRQHLQ
jgi:hypothetical protein